MVTDEGYLTTGGRQQLRTNASLRRLLTFGLDLAISGGDEALIRSGERRADRAGFCAAAMRSVGGIEVYRPQPPPICSSVRLWLRSLARRRGGLALLALLIFGLGRA